MDTSALRRLHANENLAIKVSRNIRVSRSLFFCFWPYDIISVRPKEINTSHILTSRFEIQ